MSVDIDANPDLLLPIQHKLRIVQYRYGSLPGIASIKNRVADHFGASYFLTQTITCTGNEIRLLTSRQSATEYNAACWKPNSTEIWNLSAWTASSRNGSRLI